MQQRQIRRVLLFPCLFFILFTAAYFKAVIVDSVRPAPVEIRVAVDHTITVTQTVDVVKTVTHRPSVTPLFHEPVQEHKWREDGLLEVNPNGRHPIYDLIDKAEKEWDSKVKRQSKTLDEAVTEYERRYRRSPPKGFDDWWFYCERNNVQLPDEYDRIYHDLEPFWGMSPADLRRTQAEREKHRDSYTIGKNGNERVMLVATALEPIGPDSPTEGHLGQAKELMNLLNEVSDFLPPFRAVFNPHDNPNLFTDYELKKQTLDAAAAKKYVNLGQAPPVKHGWPSACSPNSALSRSSFDINIPPPSRSAKTFIYDHLKAMDPCAHPSLLFGHGEFLAHNQGPTPNQVMVPQFSYSVTLMHHDMHPATNINWMEDVPRATDPEWEDKIEDRLMWRGTTTGMWASKDTRWRNQQRMRTIQFANLINGSLEILRSTDGKGQRVGKPAVVRRGRVNPGMFDIGFTDEAHSCDDEAGICQVIEKEYEFRERMDLAEAGNYKYVLDIDGNGWSSRFKRLIVSNSLIFKSTVYPEWFTERIQPWLHYVPIQIDLSDVHDALTFFRGDLGLPLDNGKNVGAHEEMAAKMAKAGRQWAKTFWRKEDLIAYNFRLFLEYARVMSVDREAASYKEWDTAWEHK